MAERGNLFHELPVGAQPAELFETLAGWPGVRIERIVSTGQAGEWLDQDWPEWVALIAGAAELDIEGEASPLRMAPGDWVFLPARRRHRVAWTSVAPAAVWIAVHGTASAP